MDKKIEINDLIDRLFQDENKMMHGHNDNGSYMYYTKDGHYISINQIKRILKELKK